MHGGEGRVEEFAAVLKEMMLKIKETGAEMIFISQGPYCTHKSPHINDERFNPCIERMCELEKNGTLKKYYETYIKVAKSCGAKICDLYSIWSLCPEIQWGMRFRIHLDL